MQNAFFSLVRAGLWGTPAPAEYFRTLTPAQWQELYHLAHTQALLALTFDGVNTLPDELRPPRPLYLKWGTQTLRIEQANDRLNRMVTRLNDLYTQAGLHPILLKGQGMAVCYRQPLHRQCGDIDVYLGKAGQATANRLLQAAGAKNIGEDSNKHAAYDLDGVHIENHRLLTRLNNPLANRRFNRLLAGWYPHGENTGYGMPVPPPTFNALYIFLHAFEHFLSSGIGLRQLCDWCRLLYVRHNDIDTVQLTAHLQRLGLLRAAQTFGHVAVHCLGLSPEYLPFSTKGCDNGGEALVQEILATGNFGQYDRRIKPRPAGYWQGKWYTFCRALLRDRRLYSYAPWEALFHPLMLIRGTVQIQVNKLTRGQVNKGTRERGTRG